MTSTDVSRFADITDIFAEQTGHPSSSFAAAFTETVDGFQMTRGDEPITAGLPDAWEAERASEMVVQTLFDVMRDTRLEDIAGRLAWGVVHAFHKVAQQLDQEADRAAMKVKDLIRSADGSEVGTVEIEEAQTLCQSLDEAREAVACMRDRAAETYRVETRRPWSAPRATLVSSKRTASVIDGTNFLAARRQRRIEAQAPQGPVVIFSGGQRWHDDRQLWDRLDQIKARVPAMVLVTTAQGKGCDAIAAAWAASRGVTLVAMTLNHRLGSRAGFARNEQLIKLQPVEAVVCEGSGLQSHLARAVRAAGIPAHFFRYDGQQAA
ncbi:DUF2493 domain-containing protein [Sphingomonas sp. SORGH_AS_0789]|uniref:DUF2493 domain-containing protein n=1 Tax=Sphingomonas sp. SORGH_AS_0789 TaxID=3041799 RepID=UPI00285F5795|nr:DUF2493 domain-containing protein [Sphingomonas sp. SORGH_AS_0789]MDR6116537.1 hypothetical protein [Sphingomonas sp. SORGH_AS_0789]